MYFSGDVFHGNWEDNIIYGKNCFMMYRNGDIFQGGYRGGIRCGFGKYQFLNGEIIEG